MKTPALFHKPRTGARAVMHAVPDARFSVSVLLFRKSARYGHKEKRFLTEESALQYLKHWGFIPHAESKT